MTNHAVTAFFGSAVELPTGQPVTIAFARLERQPKGSRCQRLIIYGGKRSSLLRGAKAGKFRLDTKPVCIAAPVEHRGSSQ